MPKRNINNNILINFLRLILFSFHFFPQFIFCEGTCPSASTSDLLINDRTERYSEGDCLFSVKTNEWHKCYTESQYGTSRNFYAVGSGNKCAFGDSCKNFDTYIMAVYGTNECIESCAKINDTLKSHFVQYGDYCIHDQTLRALFGENSSPSDYELIPNNGYQILKCNFAEYNTTIARMNLTKCIKGKYCPEEYTRYDYEDHKCIKDKMLWNVHIESIKK